MEAHDGLLDKPLQWTRNDQIIEKFNYGTAIHYPRQHQKDPIIQQFIVSIENGKQSCGLRDGFELANAKKRNLNEDPFLKKMQAHALQGIQQFSFHISDISNEFKALTSTRIKEIFSTDPSESKEST